MKYLSQIRRGAAVLASAGLLCGVLGSGTAVAAGPTSATEASHGFYKGRVVARVGAPVRTGPSTRFRVVGELRRGGVVAVACKVDGQRVRGNSRWYKLRDGRYAWSRNIANIGPIPRWCHRHHHHR
ncbi:SH3 domain-containing protein [Streptomyces sp. NPDC059101]|uniref:SH3 domain-containing protein n=1 Tax=Streptomyces sp. NPDC059101 TaxID=3346728 RepID=UPI00369E08F3